ncbi:MAG: isoamylase early set domain-containing protein [Gemmatimonadota bacterium]
MKIHSDMEHEGDEPGREDADFARQLGSILRTAESPRPGFEERVRAAVQTSQSPQTAPSAAAVLRLQPRAAGITAWRRRRSVTLPPAGWGALAAGFAALVSLGTLAVARTGERVQRSPEGTNGVMAQTTRQAVASPSHDTVYVVRFVLTDARAQTVSLVGDFNAWARRATPLVAVKPGVWSAQVALPAGRHEYAFVVDGKHWVADPSSERLADDFDTPSSVVTVGSD